MFFVLVHNMDNDLSSLFFIIMTKVIFLLFKSHVALDDETVKIIMHLPMAISNASR